MTALNRLKKHRLVLQQMGTATTLVLDEKGEAEVLMETAVDTLEMLLVEMARL